MTQMLLRASNGVGYTNYPDNVVQAFVAQAADSGVDVFRVFDSLNWVDNMRVAMDAVIAANKVCEGSICYTGDMLDPDRSKYDLKYYVDMGKELKAAGAHVLGLKDMAGLLKPAAAHIPDAEEYHREWGLNRERLASANDGCVVLHPGPMNRGAEIDSSVADGERSVIVQQVRNGVFVRMATLLHLLGA